jgi:hypothetical protein
MVTMALTLTNLVCTRHQIVTENTIWSMTTITMRIDRMCMTGDTLTTDILILSTTMRPRVRVISTTLCVRPEGLASNIVVTTVITIQRKVGRVMSMTQDINTRMAASEQRGPTMNVSQKIALHRAQDSVHRPEILEEP